MLFIWLPTKKVGKPWTQTFVAFLNTLVSFQAIIVTDDSVKKNERENLVNPCKKLVLERKLNECNLRKAYKFIKSFERSKGFLSPWSIAHHHQTFLREQICFPPFTWFMKTFSINRTLRLLSLETIGSREKSLFRFPNRSTFFSMKNFCYQLKEQSRIWKRTFYTKKNRENYFGVNCKIEEEEKINRTDGILIVHINC